MNGIAKEKLGKTMTVRNVPGALAYSYVGEIEPYAEFDFVGYSEDIQHLGDPAYSWLELPDGNFVNHIYPPNGLRVDILQEPGTEPPPVEKKVVKATILFDDGSTEELFPK